MKLLFDQNLSLRLVNRLAVIFPYRLFGKGHQHRYFNVVVDESG